MIGKMRGRITLKISKRNLSREKYPIQIDIFIMDAFISESRYYRVYSKVCEKFYLISRDEKALIKLVFKLHGEGDYSILMFGKGKRNRGFRRFWDGIIGSEGKFLRRREVKSFEVGGIYNTETEAYNSEYYIRRFMRTKYSGVWHSL